MNEKTVTRDEALAFIAEHCDWNPLPDETAAARRLIEAGITNEDLDRMHCNAELQDRIDAILYAGFWVHRNKGTWRDMRSALIVFARNLLLVGDSTVGFPSAFALNGPACARPMKPREVSVRPTKVCAAAA